jgi:uncharacterized peroxidase-related enzyme
MAFLPSLGPAPHLYEVMKKYPYFAIPTFRLHDILMRGDTPFTVAERELIFAYVSGLNACSFCYRGHVAAAKLWGIDEALMDGLMGDLDALPVSAKFRAVLRFCKKLTETPGRMTEADANSVYDAGWDEDALFTAVGIVALTCFMNRVADGAGVVAGNTKTTIGKTKWKTYTENLLNYGFAWPADQPKPDLSGDAKLR